MIKPPVQLVIAHRLIAVLSVLPSKSYVIYGKTDTDAIDLTKLSGDLKYAIDYLGHENDNALTGASDDEIFDIAKAFSVVCSKWRRLTQPSL
jgi:hypothetical protein